MYTAQQQFYIFLCNIFGGLLAGLVYDMTHLFGIKKHKAVTLIADIVSVILCACIFVATNFFADYGKIHLFNVLGFVCGIVLEQISLKYIVADFLILLYNYLSKLAKKVKAKVLESRFYGKIKNAANRVKQAWQKQIQAKKAATKLKNQKRRQKTIRRQAKQKASKRRRILRQVKNDRKSV